MLLILHLHTVHNCSYVHYCTRQTQFLIQKFDHFFNEQIIGASLSEPHIDELNVCNLYTVCVTENLPFLFRSVPFERAPNRK